MKRSKQLIASFGIISVLFVFVAGIGVWSFINQIEESVPGIGEFVPGGKLRRVMAPVNGSVVKLLVKENETVKAGQPLIALDPEYTAVEKSGVSEQLAHLRDQVRTLEAAYQGKESIRTSNSHFGKVQSAWLEAAQQANDAKLASARMQIQKSEHLYKEAVERQRKTEALLKTSLEMYAKYQRLHEKGGLPLKDLKEYEQRVTDLKGQLAALDEEIAARRFDAEQARQEVVNIEESFNQELLSNMTTVERSMTDLERELGKVDVTIENQVIRAPMDGVVHELQVHGAGEFVSAGAVLLSLVPLDSEMLAEVKVTNQDLSYLHLNQRALLQIDALPYQQFGKLEGVIQAISPSTTKDEEGRPFYLVYIKPDRQTVMKDGKRYPLRSGMTLSAQLITREKNLISFFTEPILQHLDRAFRDPSKY